MSQKSSINFKPSKSFQVFHNSIVRPNYAIGGELISNRNGYEALELKEQIVNQAIETYKSRTKRAFQAKSYEWSAVCNIKEDTTMADLERLAKHFEDEYGFQCYQIAIHRDEGHLDDDDNKIINHHAHLEFITLDKNTGRNRQRDLKPEILRQIQTEVAEILGMERGVDKRKSKRERIEPRKFAQMKEQEREAQKELKAEHKKKLEAKDQTIQELKTKNQELEAELKKEKLSSDEVKAYIEQFRKDCIGKGLPKEFFRKISNLKQQAEATIKELLDDTLETLLQSYLREKEKNIKLENEALKAENNEIKAQKLTLTQDQIQEIINQALAQKEAEIEKKNQEISKLQAEKEQFQELLEKISENQTYNENYTNEIEVSEQNQEEYQENMQNPNPYITNDLLKAIGFKDDVSELQAKNTNKTENQEEDQEEYQDQDQTHNEDDLGIDKIIRRKNKA